MVKSLVKINFRSQPWSQLALAQGVDIVAAHIGGTMRSVCKPLPRRGPGAAAAGGGASCQAS